MTEARTLRGLVERLNSYAMDWRERAGSNKPVKEAAAELEAQERLIETLYAALDLAASRGCSHCADSIRAARTALAQARKG